MAINSIMLILVVLEKFDPKDLILTIKLKHLEPNYSSILQLYD